MNIIERYFKKNSNIKKVFVLVAVALGIFLITFILWGLLFSKYYIFSKQEEKFLEAVKSYYSYKENLLPKKGEIREITLEKMFLENRLESLYIPKTTTLCDTNSWVRVYHNENDEYIYYVYLKCGKYESNIDHTGPVITLNGDSEIIINHGQAYQELGVKSVVDNVDGKIDPSKVEIDSSKVDTSKTGSYKVTYKVRDKLNNQTKITRTVIVARNLTEVVKQETDDSNYYKGQVDSNYVQFSGMLWRIINVNSDGSVKLISEDITNNLRYTEDKYKDSSIDKWLNKVFLPSITSSSYLVESDYCVGNINSIEDISNACSEKITSKVGLLSIDEYNKTLVDGISSISYKNNVNFLLSNKSNSSITVTNQYRSISSLDTSDIPPIKPVISIKNNVYITSGNGTKDYPYKLEDYKYGNEHDKVNTRIVGEYIMYSGIPFRILGIDQNNNVNVIMAEPFMNNTTNSALEVSLLGIEHYKFNIVDDNNPGYVINNNFIDYIDDSSLIASNYNLITNVSGTAYDKFKTQSIKTKLMLVSTIDLFSGLNVSLTNNSKRIQLFSDITDNDTVIMLNVVDGMSYELPTIAYNNYSVRVKTVLDGNLKIKSGKGTVNNPYILK